MEKPKPKVLFPEEDALRVVVAQTKTAAIGKYRIHLLTHSGTAVGCGWKPRSGSIQDLLQEDFDREPELYGKCTRCFKSHGFPASWFQDEDEVNEAPDDSDSSLDSGSDTDDSLDTALDCEGVALPVTS